MDARIRKVVGTYEDLLVEGGREVQHPVRLAAAAAVIENPYAGRYVEDLRPLLEHWCARLGHLLSERVLELLGGEEIEVFGKAALVGLDGELEHASGIIHNLDFGNPVRQAMNATSLLSSTEKRAAAGATLDVPLKHVADHTSRPHHLTVEVRVGDAPRADELVIAVGAGTAGRPHARLPEFGSEAAAGGDGGTSARGREPAR
jgi:amino acid synthesis protein